MSPGIPDVAIAPPNVSRLQPRMALRSHLPGGFRRGAPLDSSLLQPTLATVYRWIIFAALTGREPEARLKQAPTPRRAGGQRAGGGGKKRQAASRGRRRADTHPG